MDGFSVVPKNIGTCADFHKNADIKNICFIICIYFIFITMTQMIWGKTQKLYLQNDWHPKWDIYKQNNYKQILLVAMNDLLATLILLL